MRRRRPPEPCQPRPLQGVRVLDGARGLAVGNPRPRRVEERQREGLPVVVMDVVQHRHRDRLRARARRERQRAARGRIVRPRRRRAVRRGIVHRHRA